MLAEIHRQTHTRADNTLITIGLNSITYFDVLWVCRCCEYAVDTTVRYIHNKSR